MSTDSPTHFSLYLTCFTMKQILTKWVEINFPLCKKKERRMHVYIYLLWHQSQGEQHFLIAFPTPEHSHHPCQFLPALSSLDSCSLVAMQNDIPARPSHALGVHKSGTPCLFKVRTGCVNDRMTVSTTEQSRTSTFLHWFYNPVLERVLAPGLIGKLSASPPFYLTRCAGTLGDEFRLSIETGQKNLNCKSFSPTQKKRISDYQPADIMPV